MQYGNEDFLAGLVAEACSKYLCMSNRESFNTVIKVLSFLVVVILLSFTMADIYRSLQMRYEI